MSFQDPQHAVSVGVHYISCLREYVFSVIYSKQATYTILPGLWLRHLVIDVYTTLVAVVYSACDNLLLACRGRYRNYHNRLMLFTCGRSSQSASLSLNMSNVGSRVCRHANTLSSRTVNLRGWVSRPTLQTGTVPKHLAGINGAVTR